MTSVSSIAAPASSMPMRYRKRNAFNPLVHGLAWFYAFLLGVPLYFLVVSSFKSNSAIFNDPFSLPGSIDFTNFVDAWNNAIMGPALMNSVITTVAAELITLALAIPAAYAIARAKGSMGALVERFFALGLLIPAFAALVPTLLLSVMLNMFQTREFFILFQPATALPLSVILLTQFMRTVPPELEESAMIDGAGRFRILVSIYMPIIVPGVVTVMILNFLNFWNEYLFALVLIGLDPEIRTVQVALPNLASQTATQYAVLLAGCLITMLPVYLVYILMQRRLEDALLAGAVKS